MRALYLASVWLHVVAAAVWVGGMIFFALAVAPALRHPAHRKAGEAVRRRAGARYQAVAWGTLCLLALTGALNLAARGVAREELLSPTWWRGAFGRLLAAKLALVLAIVALSLTHDLALRAAAPRGAPARRAEAHGAVRWRWWARLLGRLTIAVSLAVLAVAVMMVRGAPW